MSNELTQKTTFDLLREKIKSKMDVTWFFAAFITIFLSIISKDVVTALGLCTPGLCVGIGYAGILLMLFSLSLSVKTEPMHEWFGVLIYWWGRSLDKIRA